MSVQPSTPRRPAPWPPIVLALAAAAAYSNSLSVPFLLDDLGSIPNNPTIRSLGRIAEVLAPPSNETVGGRPLLNLSLAINHAVGGTEVAGYHVANLALHILAGWTLFGVVRRTLHRPRLRPRFGAAANSIGFAVALLWTVHPLQAESVTYIVQRAEALAGLLYLLTLYGFVRELEADEVTAATKEPPPSVRQWRILAVAACYLGVASKEVLASAPLIVLLYDRTFGAGSWRDAWRARPRFYLALFGSWVPLAASILGTGGRGGTVGFGADRSVLEYAAIQCWAILQYLKLSFWPHPLVFDYGLDLKVGASVVVAGAAALGALLVATGVALRRWPAAGFVGVFFFAVLAPSSSFVPVATELVAEHRMYLPLAAVLVLPIAGLYSWRGADRALVACLAGAAILGVLTFQRNRDYGSATSIWSDTVAKQPHNSRALNNLGMAWAAEGRLPEAIGWFERALAVDPRHAEAGNNLGGALLTLGRPQEALPHLESAVRERPDLAEAAVNLGMALTDLGRPEAALPHFESALRSRPAFAEAEHGLGRALAAVGRLDEGIAHYDAAVRLKPEYSEAENNLAVALFQLGRLDDAARHFARALQLEPNLAEAANGLGAVLTRQGRLDEAREQFETALRIRPDDPDALRNLALLEGRAH